MRGIALGINALLALLVLAGWWLELREQSLSLSPDLWLRAAYTLQVATSIWALLHPAASAVRALALFANASLAALNLWLLFRFVLGGAPAPGVALGMLIGMGLLPAAVNLVALGRASVRGPGADSSSREGRPYRQRTASSR
jgi:hypothetical protein